MSDSFVYLLFNAVPFFIAALIIYILRADLRRYMIKVGIAGGIVGVVSEFWYFKDYWRPPSLFGVATPSIEDFVFGFSATALAAALPYVISRQKKAASQPGKRKRAFVLVLIGLGSLAILSSGLGVNSIISTFVIFGGVGIAMLILRPTSTKNALITAAIVGGFAFVCYSLIALFSPHFFANYYLLSSQPLGVTIFGLMPLTEFLWYFLWGFAGSVIFEYIDQGQSKRL